MCRQDMLRVWRARFPLFPPPFYGGFPPFSIYVRYLLIRSNILIICVYQSSVYGGETLKKSYANNRIVMVDMLYNMYTLILLRQHISTPIDIPLLGSTRPPYVCVCIVFILVAYRYIFRTKSMLESILMLAHNAAESDTGYWYGQGHACDLTKSHVTLCQCQ